MTLNEVKKRLDSKITFADFTTLAIAFMACGALWWRVGAVEAKLNEHLQEAGPIIREYKASQVIEKQHDGDIGDMKKKLETMQLDLAEIKGALGIPPRRRVGR